jgi:phosphatidylglycerophosphate synthase/phosphatidylglycerophosphatase A
MKKYHNIIVNSITLSRILVVIPILFFTNSNYLITITVWTGFSDFADGFLARKWQVTTPFGAKLDQYVDKISSLFLLIFFFNSKQISFFFVALIVLREILVLIFRRLNWSNAQTNFFGKAKTFYLYLLFIYLSAKHIVPSFFIDLKMILMLLVISCSWFSYLFSFSKLAPHLNYAFATTGLSAILIKNASGTTTSLLVFLLLFLGLNDIALEYKISVLLFLLLIHFTYYNSFLNQLKSLNDDPSIYTLDETLAIVMAWLFVGKISIIEVAILFLLFRFFDILKPLGIKKIERQVKLPPALRNLLDDVLAMIYTLIVFKFIQIYVG